MSHTVQTLKKIASGEEYQALEAAIREVNTEAIFNSYTRISGMLEESEKAVLERIQKLPRKNKETDWQKFQAAFTTRSRMVLPQWHRIDSELKNQRVMEGTVFAFGTKGDPLVKTPEGRIVVIQGATLKEGEKVKFKVVTEGKKLDFGSVFELTPDTFYFILTQDTRQKIVNCFNSLKDHLDAHSQSPAEKELPELSRLLKELEDVRELASKLRSEEKERIIARTLAYRKRLLKESMPKLVFEFLSMWEEKEIENICQGDQQQLARALSAPGLFRYQAHLASKAELPAREKPEGYFETVDKLEKNIDSMEKAVQLLDFKTKIDELYPAARRYLARVDRLFERLADRSTDFALNLEANVCDTDKIQSAIEKAFSSENLCAELRKAFRSSQEFFDLRGGLGELRAKLGDTENRKAEAAIEPYLRRIITAAFGTRSLVAPVASTQ